MALSKTLIFNVKRNEPEMVRALGKQLTSTHEIKQFSDIDDQKGFHSLVPSIFSYPPSSKGTTLEPIKAIRDGLAKALESYYPFAGRVIEGPNRKLMIDCNNEGVAFVEAKANIQLEQLGNGIMPPRPYVKKLIFFGPDSQGIIGSPLLFVQVTRFMCGGFSLGILVSHLIVDAFGLMQFLNAIGELVRGSSTLSIQPVWQRELFNARLPPTITCIHNEYDQTLPYNKPLVYPEDSFIHSAVLFGPKEIQALRNQMPTSSFSVSDAITACLWKCRTIALEPHPDDTVRVSVFMNARLKKGINVPRGYYGNACAYPAAVSKASTLCTSPLAYALNLVQAAKSQMSVEYIQSVADLMVIKGRPKYVETLNFLVSDIRCIEFDKLDLGWGKPSFGGFPLSTPVIIYYNNVKNHKGEDIVEVPIYLPSLVMEKFHHELLKMTREPISRI